MSATAARKVSHGGYLHLGRHWRSDEDSARNITYTNLPRQLAVTWDILPICQHLNFVCGVSSTILLPSLSGYPSCPNSIYCLRLCHAIGLVLVDEDVRQMQVGEREVSVTARKTDFSSRRPGQRWATLKGTSCNGTF